MNYTEFLDLAVQIISKNLNPQNKMITGALLGELLRQAAPDVSWKKFGKRSLFAVLEDLKSDGRIEFSNTDKGALAVLPTAQAVRANAPQVETYNPLRKAMWEAFVLLAPVGRRFIHQATGTIRAGLELAPAPADEWKEISPIGADNQKQWASEFLSQQDSARFANSRQLLATSLWNAPAFARSLKDENESAFKDWNRYRSSLVSSEVQRWLLDNNLPVEWAFQQHNSQLNVSAGDPGDTAPDIFLSQDNMRRVILAALAELPLEKLLKIGRAHV